jgi:hypothetical protein
MALVDRLHFIASVSLPSNYGWKNKKQSIPPPLDAAPPPPRESLLKKLQTIVSATKLAVLACAACHKIKRDNTNRLLTDFSAS